MHDLDDDPDTDSSYECLACGEVTTATTRPGNCPECGKAGAFRNRAFALE